MAKISKQSIEFRVNGASKYYQIEINYVSKGAFFYANIPEEFSGVAVLLSDDQRREMNIVTNYKTRNAFDGGKDIVQAKTEADVIRFARSTFQQLADLQKETRPVIVVYFREKSAFSSSNKPTTNKEHPEREVSLGLLYCLETRVAGGSPDYSIDGRRASLPFRFDRGEGGLILDDTPETRIFLEHTHSMLTKLIDRMSEFFGNKESLLTLIASNQKLIA